MYPLNNDEWLWEGRGRKRRWGDGQIVSLLKRILLRAQGWVKNQWPGEWQLQHQTFLSAVAGVKTELQVTRQVLKTRFTRFFKGAVKRSRREWKCAWVSQAQRLSEKSFSTLNFLTGFVIPVTSTLNGNFWFYCFLNYSICHTFRSQFNVRINQFSILKQIKNLTNQAHYFKKTLQ